MSAPETHSEETQAGTVVTTSEEDEREATQGAAPGEGPDETPDAIPDPEAASLDAGEASEDEEAVEPAKEVLGPGQEKSDEELLQEAAVLLFASPDPLSPGKLRNLLLKPEGKRVKALLEALSDAVESSPLPLALRRIAGGWRILTDPEYGDVVARLQADPKPDRISAAALETLAIVAYRQPVTKAEIEAIRGVQAGAILRTLVDRRLARVTGRANLPGSPLQYGTTREFLERFGLASLKDLPRDGELTES